MIERVIDIGDRPGKIYESFRSSMSSTLLEFILCAMSHELFDWMITLSSDHEAPPSCKKIKLPLVFRRMNLIYTGVNR